MKKKVYMVCDWASGNYNQGANDIQIEYMGDCYGRLLKEDGSEIDRAISSSFGWLRQDLVKGHDLSNYEVIDLIGKPVPDKFKTMFDYPRPNTTYF